MTYTSEPLILALDISTAGCNAAIISVSGVTINSEFNKINLIYPITGGTEINPEELWYTILKTVSSLAGRNTSSHHQLAAICCSSSCEGMIPVDKNGNALKNALVWNDWQPDRDNYSIFKGWKSSAGVDLKKLQRWAKLHEGEAFPGVDSPAMQLLLFRDLYPTIYKKTHKLINILDYINCQLTGRLVSTQDSDLKEWITDKRNPVYNVFSQDLMRDRGFDVDKMNEIVPNTAVIGELRTEVAGLTNLPTGVKVVAGAMAVTTSSFGAGAIRIINHFTI